MLALSQFRTSAELLQGEVEASAFQVLAGAYREIRRCYSEEDPEGTCFVVRSEVGIRRGVKNMPAVCFYRRSRRLQHDSIYYVFCCTFSNRLPRQYLDWLAMTVFFGKRKSFGVGFIKLLYRGFVKVLLAARRLWSCAAGQGKELCMRACVRRSGGAVFARAGRTERVAL